MKKILFLGAAKFQTPPIHYALNQGYTVITADNRPTNVGHALAHKSYNISTTNRQAIAQMARREQVDAIVAFGSDISALTAAYVCELLDIPSNSYQTVQLLCNKHLFRQWLRKEKLQHINFAFFTQMEKTKALRYLHQQLPKKCVVKPVDSSGSKGISIINKVCQIEQALSKAFKQSRQGLILVEDFVERLRPGKQICGDGYVHNGLLAFIAFGDGYFYKNAQYLAPYAESFPSTLNSSVLARVKKQLSIILQKAGFYNGCFNFDVFIQKNGEIFINEIGPRSGGNYIPLLIEAATGVNLVAACVENALNPNYIFSPTIQQSTQVWAGYMLHSQHAGRLKAIHFNKRLQKYIRYQHPYLKVGAKVQAFTQANYAIGNIIMSFENQQNMQQVLTDMPTLCKIDLQSER